MKGGTFMKKFILCLIVLFSLTAVCFAQPNMNSATEKVAVLTDLPASIANTYDIKARIVQTATRVFPYPRFEILSYDDTVVAKKNFVKERGISGNWGKSDISFVGSMVNADYVFFVSVTDYGAGRVYNEDDSSYDMSSIRCDIKILDIANDNYVYEDSIDMEGYDTPSYWESSSQIKAYSDALQRCLDTVNIDMRQY